MIDRNTSLRAATPHKLTTFAYCAHSFVVSARLVANTQPATCPPTHIGTFNPQRLEADFVFIKLHGLPEQPFWYGDHWITALSADQIRQADLSRSVVFVASCHLPESPMLPALREANARLIIAGHGVNYTAPGHALSGPDFLALTMRRLLRWRIAPHLAFIIAREKLRRRPSQNLATRDAALFEVYT